MAKDSVILYIDDDRDDHDLIQQAFAELGVPNKVVCINNGEDAFRHLKTEGLRSLSSATTNSREWMASNCAGK